MNILQNLSFRHKLLLLIIVPLIGILIFATSSLKAAFDEYKRDKFLAELQTVMAGMSNIAHELQFERGQTSSFLASNGNQGQSRLRSQRQEANQAIRQYDLNTYAMGQLSAYPDSVNRLHAITRILERRSQIRSAVDSLSISQADAYNYYTDLIYQLLESSGNAAKLSTDATLTNLLRTYNIFLWAKESAGKERSLLGKTLILDAFSKHSDYEELVQYTGFKNAYFTSFKEFASPQQIQELEATNHSQAGRRIEEIIQIANKRAEIGNFGVSSQEWMTVSTQRVQELKTLEEKLNNEITAYIDDLLKASTDELRNTLLLTIFSLLITIGLAIYISRLITRQAQGLVNTIATVADTKDLTLKAPVLSRDELGSAAQSFNVMVENLRSMLHQIQDGSVQLSAAAEESSTAIAANAQGLHQQSTETSQAATATEEMSATASEIARHTTQTVEAVHRAQDASHQGVDEIESSVQMMNALNDEMSQANNQVIQLRESSQSIHEIVDVIKAIAEQTNLLALNAAIEAARAGDQGRGFAVVADEVRNLAQRTQQSTTQIEEMVIEFQNSAGRISNVIESSFTRVQSSVDQTISVRSKLDEINHAIELINDMCNQVATASEEQVAVANEIAENIRTINDIANVSSVTGNQIAQAAEEQTQLAAQQHDQIRQFKL